jgi:hypothetical protein
MGFPKTYLRWQEPKIARQTRAALEKAALPRWFRLAMMLLTAGLLMFSWFVATLNPQKNPLPLMIALPASLAGGLFFVYVVPLVYHVCPSYIRMTDGGISRVIGDHVKVWKYAEIQACRIASEGTEGGITVLEITTHKSKTFILGIAPKVSLDELQRVLMERKVSVCRVGLPPDKPGS